MEDIKVPAVVLAGFQLRDDTFSGKLAYLVYRDTNNNHYCVRSSWKHWCDPKLSCEEFKNLPTSGFALRSTDVGFPGVSASRTGCRIYDPRGFDVDITMENLLYLLSNTKYDPVLGFEEELLYAWKGSQMVLIPKNSRKSKLTLEPSQPRLLLVGAKYLTKHEEEITYLGRFLRYEDVSVKFGDTLDGETLEAKVGNKCLGMFYCFASRIVDDSGEPVFKIHSWKVFPFKQIQKCLTEHSEDYQAAMEYMTDSREFNKIDDESATLYDLSFNDWKFLKSTKEPFHFVTKKEGLMLFVSCYPVAETTSTATKFNVRIWEKSGGIFVEKSPAEFFPYNSSNGSVSLPVADIFEVFPPFRLQHYFNDGRKFAVQELTEPQMNHPKERNRTLQCKIRRSSVF